MGGGGRTWPQSGAMLRSPLHQCVQGAACQHRTLLGGLHSSQVLLAAVGGEEESSTIQGHKGDGDGWTDLQT